MGHGPELLARLFRRITDGRVAAPTTAELLGRFVATRDEEAFRALVDRHGPMVWGVCSRVLRRPPDVEDAFQATFIVLARRAAAVRPPELLPAWLHGVARRSALRVLRLSARRREVQVNTMPNPATAQPNDLFDLPAVLDEELGRLPPALRQAVVLCHLQSRTYADAAREMGCSITAVAKRLDRAAARLRGRLARRGLAPVGCTAWGLLAGAPEAAAVPADLAARTAAAALGSAPGAATPVATAAATDLLRAASRCQFLLAAVAAVAAVAAGVGLITVPFPAGPGRPAAAGDPVAAPRVDRFGDPLPAGAIARLGTVRFRAGMPHCASGVGFLTGGKTIVSAYESGTVVFWDAETGRETTRIDGPPGATALAVSADGRRLVVAGKEVWAWALTADGARPVWKRPSPNGGERISVAALSPDGKRLACGSSAGGHLLDAATGDTVRPLAVKAPRLMAFAAAGSVLVATGRGPIHVFDPVTGDERRQLAAPDSGVVQLAVSPDGTRAAAVEGNLLFTWDLKTGRERARVPCTSATPVSPLYFPACVLAFTPDGRTLLEAGGEQIRYRDPTTGAELRPAVRAAHLLPYYLDLAPTIPTLSPDGRLLAVPLAARIVGVWRTDTGAEVGPAGGPYGEVSALAFTPDGTELVTTSGFNHVQVWNPATGHPGRRLAMPAAEMVADAMVVSPAGEVQVDFSRFGADGRPGVVRWAARPGETPAAIVAPKPWAARAVASSADGRRVVWGHETTLIVADRSTAAETRRVDTRAPVSGVAVAADGGTAAAYASKENILSVWDLGTGRERMRVSARLGAAAAVSPDGRWVAGLEGDAPGPYAVQLWEVAAGRAGPRFPVGPSPVTPLLFSPDGRLLAAGGQDGRVWAWDLAAGTGARHFARHNGPVRALAFAPAVDRLASGSGDGTALVWDLGPLLRWPAPAARAWEPSDAQWRGLGRDDPAKAARTTWALVASGDAAVPFLRAKLKPPVPPPATRLTALINQLGHDGFEDRERATEELADLGIAAEPALRAAAATDLKAEVRLRVDRLIARLAPARSPDLMAAVRAVAALERIGTPAAVRALSDVAAERGHPVFVAEAEAAVRRSAGRAGSPRPAP